MTQIAGGVRIELDGKNPYETRVMVGDTEIQRIVRWPIDIHIDGDGAVVTLTVPILSLKAEGIEVLLKEPDDSV